MIKVKLNIPMAGMEKNSVVEIATDKRGIPTDIFWRKRIRDSKTDNCLEIVPEEQPKKSKEKA